MNTKALFTFTIGTASVLAAGAAFGQSGTTMNGGGGMVDHGSMGAGLFGGFWVPVLLVVALVGFVAWMATRKDKE